MPEEGLEPSRHYWQRILSPQRLPFRHSGKFEKNSSNILLVKNRENSMSRFNLIAKTSNRHGSSILKHKFEQKLAFRKLLWFIISMIKVLVVDDEESILKGIRLNLGRTFDITLANSPHEALKTFEEEGPFEVIVSDMRMPGMDGATMLRKIKEANPEVMTILLTGHADFEFGGTQALQSGMLFRILNKPCPPQKLSATIKAAIQERDSGGQDEQKAPDTVL